MQHVLLKALYGGYDIETIIVVILVWEISESV